MSRSTSGRVEIVVAIIGAMGLIAAAAVPFLLHRNGATEITYSGRVSDGTTGTFLRDVDVSVDAQPPIVTHTDAEGVFSVTVRREALSRDVRLYFRKPGFELYQRTIDPKGGRLEDIRLSAIRAGTAADP